MIAAKASAPAPRDTILEMLQTLLADRFKLAFHREKRELPVYALVVSKNGPKLTEAKDDSVSEINGGTNAEFRGVPMEMLANVLASSSRPAAGSTTADRFFTVEGVERGGTMPSSPCRVGGYSRRTSTIGSAGETEPSRAIGRLDTSG